MRQLFTVFTEILEFWVWHLVASCDGLWNQEPRQVLVISDFYDGSVRKQSSVQRAWFKIPSSPPDSCNPNHLGATESWRAPRPKCCPKCFLVSRWCPIESGPLPGCGFAAWSSRSRPDEHPQVTSGATRLRVNPSVAHRTQGDEVVLRIIARLAPQFYVMDFESAQRAASLATPAIPFEDFPV